ncbi:MAG: phosphate/phosphite/phosphonate ABC transporter substrate-binding protein [Bacillota bacterium]
MFKIIKKLRHPITTILILILFIPMLIAGCNGRPINAIDISLKDMEVVETNKINNKSSTLRVAFSSITSPKESIIYYSDLLKYIERNLGLTVEVIQRKTYQEVNDLVEAGEVDLAFICTYAYTLGTKKFGLEPFLVPQINGKVTYQSYVLVPQDSLTNKFEELAGKRFAFTDPLSNTGFLYPKYLLKQKNETAESFFKNTMFTYSHDNSIRAVSDKIVDGAAVDGLVFEYLIEKKPEIKDKVRVITKSEEFGIPPVVVSPKVNIEIKDKLKKLFLNLHNTEEGRSILNHLNIDRFLEQEDSNYDSIRKIASEVLNGE